MSASGRAAWLFVAATLAGLGCSPTPETTGQPLLVTAVESVPTALDVEPAERYPNGSRLLLVDADRGDLPPRLVSEEMVAAGGANVAPDGRRIVFVGKAAETDPYSVWTALADGSDRRELARFSGDCGAAAWLPDGRVVVSARVEAASPSPYLRSAWSLFVVGGDGRPPQRITFAGGEVDPAVLHDGRIVYSQWLPPGDGRPTTGAFALFTVHPDGTGMQQLHGHHLGPELKLLPRQTTEGDVLYLAADRGGPATLWAVDHRALAERSPIELGAARVLAAEPTNDSGILLAIAEGSNSRLRRLVGGDPVGPLALPSSGLNPVHAVAVAPRSRPQGHLSMVDLTLDRGHLLGIDARPSGARDAASVRVSTASPGSARAVLGVAPLREDGSFFAVVPADVPLWVDVLDADGRALEVSSTPFWVRPKEVRGCLGCHDDGDEAPPNRRPLAVLEEPVDLTGGDA